MQRECSSYMPKTLDPIPSTTNNKKSKYLVLTCGGLHLSPFQDSLDKSFTCLCCEELCHCHNDNMFLPCPTDIIYFMLSSPSSKQNTILTSRKRGRKQERTELVCQQKLIDFIQIKYYTLRYFNKNKFEAFFKQFYGPLQLRPTGHQEHHSKFLSLWPWFLEFKKRIN